MTNPFLIAALLALGVSGLLLVRWALAVASLRADARQEYRGRQADRAQTIAGVSEADFIRIYTDGHSPRWTIYAAMSLIGAILVTPPAVFGLIAFWRWITAFTDAGEWFAIGYYPWMFYMFFGLVAAWAFCGFIAARLHHQRAPESFQIALMRARGEDVDDIAIKRPRPKWARRASVIAASKEAIEGE